MALAGKKRKIFDGRYEILSIVGRGACSVVYHARHAVAPGSEVALKVLLNEKDQKASSEKLRKEALAMVSSRHKYVVRLDDFHSVGELCYLSMEFAPESDLRKYSAKSGGKLSPVQAELFLLQVSEALAFIHRAGIVHRDIKPDNILVVNPKEIRLADFGVAVLPGEKSSLAELQKGVGTMDYMGPEVLEGKNYDSQSDIYALGVTFYELLSGKHPFSAAPLVEQLAIRKEGKFPHLREAAPEVPAYLANVVMQAMSYEPSARFPTTKELAQALLVSKAKPADVKKTAVVAPTAAAAAPAPKPTPQAAPAAQPTPIIQPAVTAPTATVGPSPAVLAAVRAAASRQSASAAATATATPAVSTVAPPAAASTRAQVAAPSVAGLQRPNIVTADSPDARKAAAQALANKTPTAQTGAAAVGNALLNPAPQQSLHAPPAPSASPKTIAKPEAAPFPSTPQRATPSPAVSAPTKPAASAIMDVAATQVISREMVAEVTGSSKSGSLISRAFDAPTQSSSTPERRDLTGAAGVKPPARATSSSPDNLENKKATQLITRDLVNQVRAGMKEELAKQAKSEPKSVEETVILKPAQAPKVKKKPTAPAVKAAKAPAEKKQELWKKDPKKSMYMALSMGVLLVILYFGNIFLIKNYHIGIGKSFLGVEEEIISPIPQYAGQPLAFPTLPSGLYTGSAKHFLGDRTVPITLISFAEQKKMAVIVGIEGWSPAVVSVDPAQKRPEGSKALRIVSNGLVLNMTGAAGNGEIQGFFQDVITGDQSDWRVKPVAQQAP